MISKIFRFLWYGLVNFQRMFMLISGCIITVLIFVEVMLRYVLGSPLFGVEELIVLIAMWIYFIGASYGAYERSHIKAELIHTLVKSPKKAALVHSMTSGITFILSLVMVSWTYPFFIWSITKGGTSQALLLPMYYSQSAIFIGAILMSLYFFTEFVDHILQFLGKKSYFERLN
ncbi:MAG: TRAP transporter small permease [Candidatus Atribacteria bacterium]|nr:TRAP transporter small permease [Candidatus Atribacteria bacterium]